MSDTPYWPEPIISKGVAFEHEFFLGPGENEYPFKTLTLQEALKGENYLDYYAAIRWVIERQRNSTLGTKRPTKLASPLFWGVRRKIDAILLMQTQLRESLLRPGISLSAKNLEMFCAVGSVFDCLHHGDLIFILQGAFVVVDLTLIPQTNSSGEQDHGEHHFVITREILEKKNGRLDALVDNIARCLINTHQIEISESDRVKGKFPSTFIGEV